MQLIQASPSKATLRVRRQLVEAILYEGLLPYTEHVIDYRQSRYTIQGMKGSYCCLGRRSAFGRIRIQPSSVVMTMDNNQKREVSVKDLIEELNQHHFNSETLLAELEDTIFLTDWNDLNLSLPPSRRELSMEELESAIVEGHPYHPCFKSRTGFTIHDHYSYGPEANQPFSIVWIAVRRKEVRYSFPKEEQSFWQNELGTKVWKDLVLELCQCGGQLDEYMLFPVHPWQWQQIEKHITEELESRDILLLGEFGDLYTATQSVRTLMNQTTQGKSSLKLAMNLVHTSSRRTLAPQSVFAAPEISAWLKAVVGSDDFLVNDKRLVILAEHAGMVYEPKDPIKASKIEGQLAAIWREDIHGYLRETEEAIPFNALMLIERDGQPFVWKWIEAYGVSQWVAQLIKVAVIPVWHLLLKHGIALEAHGQNMILIHENGWPKRVALRDFHESVEYVESYLDTREFLPDFKNIHPSYANASENQFYWMSSVEALRELVMDTLFVFNLAEISYVLDEVGIYKEKDFWQQVNEALATHLKNFPSLKSRAKLLNYTNESIYVESLLTKKLNKGNEEFRHLVSNSLIEGLKEKGG
ncbi:IucA/IucC family protein [Alkalihalophilus lindianensis]|uniref:IucA/IucC family protein n=1 Tax=Alkalihalophilus lindianensis TaxID=1630542 RepID=A0ABU3XF90_9BACI|nr:IucA/IucC family protein [Alkalihalophilus lindianensis]MDV2686556.1 IucA/IucC family protein [Alkalihalophilus lindianensis]